jgi:hypothetical protein
MMEGLQKSKEQQLEELKAKIIRQIDLESSGRPKAILLAGGPHVLVRLKMDLENLVGKEKTAETMNEINAERAARKGTEQSAE